MAFPFTKPSDEDISRDFHNREQTELLVNSQLLYKQVIETSTKKKNDTIIEDPPVVVISKNDNIKRRVGQVIAKLEEEQEVFIVGKSQHTNKLITIVEIIKNNYRDGGNILHQFNKLTMVKSINNPNHGFNKQTKAQKDNLNNYLGAEAEYQNTLNEIRHGHKQYELPVLNIVLARKESQADIVGLVKAGWTHQTNDVKENQD